VDDENAVSLNSLIIPSQQVDNRIITNIILLCIRSESYAGGSGVDWIPDLCIHLLRLAPCGIQQMQLSIIIPIRMKSN